MYTCPVCGNESENMGDFWTSGKSIVDCVDEKSCKERSTVYKEKRKNELFSQPYDEKNDREYAKYISNAEILNMKWGINFEDLEKVEVPCSSRHDFFMARWTDTYRHRDTGKMYELSAYGAGPIWKEV